MRGNGRYKRAGEIWIRAVTYFFLAVILTFIAPQSELCGSTNDPEGKAVLEAARKFLDAEVRRDYPAVYACFAPSSPFARAHSFDQYLSKAKASPDHVVSYRIIRVSSIQDPEDRKAYPSVERTAQVEVEVTFLHSPTQKRSEVNIGFIFLKEKGRWYKS